MKTLKTLFTAAVISSVTIVASANADQLMDTIHPEMSDQFKQNYGYVASDRGEIVSLGQTAGKHVWSYEYQEYVNPDDFKKADLADINQYLEENPTAAGSRTEPVFKWDENADEYQLN